jgi:hypothetical protein
MIVSDSTIFATLGDAIFCVTLHRFQPLPPTTLFRVSGGAE